MLSRGVADWHLSARERRTLDPFRNIDLSLGCIMPQAGNLQQSVRLIAEFHAGQLIEPGSSGQHGLGGQVTNPVASKIHNGRKRPCVETLVSLVVAASCVRGKTMK
jgi:hypothetical protein